MPPNEVAFVETDPRYGLRFYLGAEVERVELPDSAAKAETQDIVSEMREHEGCRVLLVNDWNLGRLEKFLASDAVNDEHREALAAIRAGDAGRAVQVLRKHRDHAVATLEEALNRS